MSDDIGFRPVIRTQAELEALWRSQVRPPDDDGQSIWLLLIDADRRPLPGMLEITDAVDPPSQGEATATALAAFLRHLVEEAPGSSVAALRSRPGRGVRAEDREWAHALRAAAAQAGAPLEVVHLLTDAGVAPLPLDEIGLRSTG